MTPIRKRFFRTLAYLGLGIIPLVLFWERDGLGGFIAFTAFMFVAFQLVMLAATLLHYTDGLFPEKELGKTKTQLSFNKKELRRTKIQAFDKKELRRTKIQAFDKKELGKTKMQSLESKEPFDKFVHNFTIVFFFAGPIFSIFEIGIMDNTIGGTKLFWKYAFIGVLIFAAITAILKFKRPSVYFGPDKRIGIHIGLFIGFFLTVPATASFVNHYFIDNSVNCKEYRIITKSTSANRSKSSWLFLNINGDEERFEVSEKLWNDLNEGGPVVLCTQQGYLGYDVVKKFKSPNE